MTNLLQSKKFLLAGILFLLSPAFLWAQKFTESNHAYWYTPGAPVQSSLLVWKKSSDSLQAQASIRLNTDREIDSYRILLHLRERLNEPMEGTPPMPLHIYRRDGRQYAGQADIVLEDSLQYILLEVQDSQQPGTSFWSMVTLNPEHSYSPSPFYLTQGTGSIVLFNNYQKIGHPVGIEGRQAFYTLFFYQMPFDAAAPPHSATQGNSPSMEVTEKKIIPLDSAFSPSAEGLYFIQQDTTDLSGQSFRGVSSYFPEVGTLEEFAGPIRYLSTQDEWNQLTSNEFDKKDIDRYWLKVAQTEDRAKRIIKSYYRQVANANKYFTSYKEGWKTDQGMIYILYGTPDIVNVDEDRETWIYLKTAELPEIKFTFVRVKNPFTDRHLVLIRSKSFTRTHYQIVSQWRRGKKTL